MKQLQFFKLLLIGFLSISSLSAQIQFEEINSPKGVNILSLDVVGESIYLISPEYIYIKIDSQSDWEKIDYEGIAFLGEDEVIYNNLAMELSALDIDTKTWNPVLSWDDTSIQLQAVLEDGSCVFLDARRFLLYAEAPNFQFEQLEDLFERQQEINNIELADFRFENFIVDGNKYALVAGDFKDRLFYTDVYQGKSRVDSIDPSFKIFRDGFFDNDGNIVWDGFGIERYNFQNETFENIEVNGTTVNSGLSQLHYHNGNYLIYHASSYYHSIDNGISWVKLNPIDQNSVIFQQDILETFDGGFFLNGPGDGTFEIFQYDWQGNLVDSHLTLFDEGNFNNIHHSIDKLIAVADDAYSYESNDGGASWRRFGIGEVNRLQVYYQDGFYYSADLSGFYRSSDGENWEEIVNRSAQNFIRGKNGEFALFNNDDLTIYQSDTEQVSMFSVDDSSLPGQFHINGNYFYVDEEGLKFADVENENLIHQNDLTFLTEGRHRLRMLVSYSGAIILLENHFGGNTDSWYSLDEGRSFEKGSELDEPDPGGYQYYDDPSAVFIADRKRLFYSTDDFRSIIEINANFPESISLSSLSLDQKGYVYLTTQLSQGIFRSTEPIDLGGKIEGCIFSDIDGDCNQNGELLLPQQELKFIDQNGNTFNVVAGNSPFEVNLPITDYTVEHDYDSAVWEPCQDTYMIDQNDLQKLEIGLQPLIDCAKLEGQFSFISMRRCFDNNLKFNACNTGTQFTVPGTTIEITLGEHLIFKEASVPLLDQRDSTYIFDASGLGPFECQRVNITYEVSCDAEFGELHCITGAVVLPESCDGPNSISSVENCMHNTGSYDPNDMHSIVDGEWTQMKNIDLETDYIDYLVRFQNTGTDTAFTVRISSFLSEYLDLEKIDIIDFSHDFIYQTDNEGELEMVFDNILLPDSTVNLVESQGFVKFRIPVVTELSEGIEVHAIADIFFDFNDPVTTNDVLLTTNILSDVEEPKVHNFDIYPNPTSEVLQIEYSRNLANGSWIIFNLVGSRLMSGSLDASAQISITDLEKGNYLFSVEVNGFRTTKKFIKL